MNRRHLFTRFLPRAVALSGLLCGGTLGVPGASAQRALVLSGGGARGIAHAGVVRAVDSLGLDPDIVVGTSMGAVVGGLYAAGLDGTAVWHQVVEPGWEEMFKPVPVLDGPRFDSRLPVIRMELGSRRKNSLRGMIAEWRVNRLLVSALFDAGARARGDFDRLPRRYRAVAVDLDTGLAVVLDRGDFTRAVRTSMAIPGAFAATESDGRVLIDGGVANYLPIGVARDMGAEWVVASDVIRPFEPLEPVTPLTVGSRGFHWLSVNARSEEDTADVTISPALEPTVTSASFLGDVAAMARAGYESTLGLSLTPLPQSEAAEEGSRAGLSAPLRFGGFEGSADGDDALEALVARTFDEALDVYDPDEVLDAVDRLYATGLFDGVWPWVEDDAADAPEPLLRVDATPIARTALLGGAGYDVDRGGRVWAAVRGRGGLRTLPVVTKASAMVGELERYGSLSAFFFPTDWAPLRWGLDGHVGEVVARSALPGGGSNSVLRAGGSVGVETRGLGPDWVFTASLAAEYVESEFIGSAEWGPRLRWETLAPLGRSVGSPALVDVQARFGEIDSWTLRAKGSRGVDLGLFRLEATGDVRLSSLQAQPDVHPALGDEHGFPGFRWGEQRGRHTLVGGVDIGYPLPLSGTFRIRARAGWVDGLALYGTAEETLYGIEAGGIWQSPFGAFELRVGANTLDQWRFDLGVGSLWK